MAELKKTWAALAERDPLWAVLSHPRDKNGGWLEREEDFFLSGDREAAAVLSHLEAQGLHVSRGACLDFGCGVGRVTFGFADYFAECHGVDIAPPMLDLARARNRWHHCRFHLNDRADLALFPDCSFDLVYSHLVLQHIPPDYARTYIAEFVRVLRPEGVAVFQIPSGERAGAGLSEFKARIRLERGRRRLTAEAQARYDLVVKNLSAAPWPAFAPSNPQTIRLGNHWLDHKGKVIGLDDARAELPHPVGPGDEIRLELRVSSPARPGSYILEFDLVQEGIAWFGDRGSETMRLPVTVNRSRRLAIPGRIIGAWPRASQSPREIAEESLGPSFDIYCVPREQVMDIVQSAGGTVLEVLDNYSTGGAWQSYQYTVTKGQAASPRQ